MLLVFVLSFNVNTLKTDPLASLLSHLLINGPHPPQPSVAPHHHLPAPHTAPSSSEVSVADRLVRAAAQGHIDVVRELLDQYPDKVNSKSSGKTCLQVSSHQGHGELVSLLLSRAANLEVADDDGDTALHYAAFG